MLLGLGGLDKCAGLTSHVPYSLAAGSHCCEGAGHWTRRWTHHWWTSCHSVLLAEDGEKGIATTQEEVLISPWQPSASITGSVGFIVRPSCQGKIYSQKASFCRVAGKSIKKKQNHVRPLLAEEGHSFNLALPLAGIGNGSRSWGCIRV